MDFLIINCQMKRIIYFVVIALAFFTACKGVYMDYDDNISIVIDNNSSDTIRVFHLTYDFALCDQYDTVIHANLSDYGLGHVLLPGYSDWTTTWQEDEDVSQDTMTIFIIKKSVYDTVPWDSIAKNYMVLQRYDVPAQYYIDHFWPRKRLTYPPNEDMCEILMWPPYENK